MYDLIKDAIKGISLTLFFLFIGIVTEFHWIFWLFVLTCVLKPFIDEAAHRLNIRAEKLRQNRLKKHPPH